MSANVNTSMSREWLTTTAKWRPMLTIFSLYQLKVYQHMFKTAANIKLYLLIKGEREKTCKSFVIAAVSLPFFCEEGREGSCKRSLFPSSTYIQRRKKKKEKAKSEKLTRSCITGKLHGEWITRNTVMKVPRDWIWAVGWKRALWNILKNLSGFFYFSFF